MDGIVVHAKYTYIYGLSRLCVPTRTYRSTRNFSLPLCEWSLDICQQSHCLIDGEATQWLFWHRSSYGYHSLHMDKMLRGFPACFFPLCLNLYIFDTFILGLVSVVSTPLSAPPDHPLPLLLLPCSRPLFLLSSSYDFVSPDLLSASICLFPPSYCFLISSLISGHSICLFPFSCGSVCPSRRPIKYYVYILGRQWPKRSGTCSL